MLHCLLLKDLFDNHESQWKAFVPIKILLLQRPTERKKEEEEMCFYSNAEGGVEFAIMKYSNNKKSDIKHDMKNSLGVSWPTFEFIKLYFTSRKTNVPRHFQFAWEFTEINFQI